MRAPVYLDHNATTPPLPEVIDAMTIAAREAWANPSSVHQAGRIARARVDDAREAVAKLADVSPRDVVLTSGGTEANNLGIVRAFTPSSDGNVRERGLLITSRLEHPSVTALAEELADRGVRVLWLDVPRDGVLRIDAIANAIATRAANEPCLIALHAVHHETGVMQDVPAILSLVAGTDIDVHVDAVQAAGRIEPSRWRGAHSLAIAGHKLRGPKGIGAVITRPGVPLRPILRGGPQERGMRPGTVDPIAASGLAVAARRALLSGPDEYAAIGPRRDRLERALIAVGQRVGVEVRSTVDGTDCVDDGETVVAFELGVCVDPSERVSHGESVEGVGLVPKGELTASRLRAEGGLSLEQTLGSSHPARVRRAPHVTHLLVHGWVGDELVAALDLEGICVSSGSACAAGTSEASPAILAMVGAAQARGSLRCSLAPTTTDDEIDRMIAAFERVLTRQ